MSPPRKAAPPVFSPREFRASLGMFATGVTIVTARTAEGERVGLTANSFNSVSLDPPLVLWSLARAAGSLPAFSAGSHYAINILAADQKALAERFAARGADRWAGVAFTEGAGRAPLLAGAAATFECFNRSRYEEGDHVIFVGEVERCSHRADASPLLFHGGKFYTEHPLQADSSAPQAPDPRFVGGYLGYLLGQASHAVYRNFERSVAAQGLTHIAWRVLALLATLNAALVLLADHEISVPLNWTYELSADGEAATLTRAGNTVKIAAVRRFDGEQAINVIGEQTEAARCAGWQIDRIYGP